ncbi:formate--tetrahydrofolate ligase [Phocaeicola coprocola DSM 17136]|uniref:Formate--tetrahydrofolate ligase n=4 Tax=Phocaeicola coprocola TaxID=310298 RepID=B3JQD1_9BACT|nr:formate--tetrahydrofolate ligase [Phocaeicola coprocola DSM 17136]
MECDAAKLWNFSYLCAFIFKITMKSDIEIARSIELTKIKQVARDYDIPVEEIHNYGRYIAKVPETLIDEEKVKQSNLILVTAITPTKAGIGKTTVSIGLALGLTKIGKKAICALREPSLGPCFGMKGGAAGGGYAQVLPMDKINLHFTGDFHAITSAHNMIAALLDNYMYQNQDNGFALKEVLWNRVLDVNDRGLRYIITGLGGKTNGITRESGFDITPASEIMAILCLAKDEDDLRRRIENILLGFTIDNKPFTVKDLGVAGAITVLLKDAIAPNLVQTTEHTAAFVHGGPFANIAHGCNSVMATKLAMTFGDYVITEAGFGADLGAEKFYDIKCRKSGLQPKLTIIVATAQGLKMHGGVSLDQIKEPNAEGLTKGLANLDKHIENLRSFGQTVVVAFNRYANDTEEEIDLVRQHCAAQGIGFAVNNAFVEGGNGAVELANLVVDTIENQPSEPLRLAYNDDDTVEEKISKVACNLYGANMITYSAAAKKKLKRIQELGYGHFPICIAKTQYSFSTDSKLYGVVKDFEFHVRDIVLNAGAEMLVIIAGEIMRMPGLPKEPQALHIDIVNGEIEGLS